MSERVLALDFGEVHCGVAVSDPTGTVAKPLGALSRPNTNKGLHRINSLARSLKVKRIIVGLPISLSGDDSAQTQATRAFAERLRESTTIPIELFDERFTTKLARQAGSQQTSEHSRAAAILLEHWLTIHQG
jgi:putative holliday junction resolvase